MATPVKSSRERYTDYPSLRMQLNDYSNMYYGPHCCEGCGYHLIVKKAVEAGGESWEEQEGHGGPVYVPHHCTHVHLFKRLAGKVLTVLDASLSSNPTQCKAVKDLVRDAFASMIASARQLEGDTSAESDVTLEQIARA